MDPNKNNNSRPRRRNKRNWQGHRSGWCCGRWCWLVLISVGGTYMRQSRNQSQQVEINYSEFTELVEARTRWTAVELDNQLTASAHHPEGGLHATPMSEAASPGPPRWSEWTSLWTYHRSELGRAGDGCPCYSPSPDRRCGDDDLSPNGGATVYQVRPRSARWWPSWSSYILPFVLHHADVLPGHALHGQKGRKAASAASATVGKANAKVYMEKKTGVTFQDVAGQDEAKESLVEIIDFLHNPQKVYRDRRQAAQGRPAGGPSGHR